MRIGPEKWRWVTIDSVGVPRGGVFGRPRAIAKKLARFGIHLAWSQIAHCFDLYTTTADGRLIHQFRCKKLGTGDPIVLCDELVDLMVHLQKHCPSGETMANRLVKQQQEHEMEVAHQQAMDDAAAKPEILRAIELGTGERTSNTSIIVPGMN